MLLQIDCTSFMFGSKFNKLNLNLYIKCESFFFFSFFFWGGINWGICSPQPTISLHHCLEVLCRGLLQLSHQLVVGLLQTAKFNIAHYCLTTSHRSACNHTWRKKKSSPVEKEQSYIEQCHFEIWEPFLNMQVFLSNNREQPLIPYKELANLLETNAVFCVPLFFLSPGNALLHQRRITKSRKMCMNIWVNGEC